MQFISELITSYFMRAVLHLYYYVETTEIHGS